MAARRPDDDENARTLLLSHKSGRGVAAAAPKRCRDRRTGLDARMRVWDSATFRRPVAHRRRRRVPSPFSLRWRSGVRVARARLLQDGSWNATVARATTRVLRRWPPENGRLRLQTEHAPNEVSELLDKLRMQRNASAAAALRTAVLTSRSLHLELWRAGDVAPFASLELSRRFRDFVVGPAAAAASRRTDTALRQSLASCVERGFPPYLRL